MVGIGQVVQRSSRFATKIARDYAEANMVARVRVTRPAQMPVFNPQTGELGMPPEETIWLGAARVASVAGPVQFNLGDEPQFFSSTFISIPMRAKKPRVDDVVEVLRHPDPNMIDRMFRVQDVEGGGHMPVVFRMQVVGIQPSRAWEDS